MKKVIAMLLIICLSICFVPIASINADALSYNTTTSLTTSSIAAKQSRNVLSGVTPSFKRYTNNYSTATAFSGGATSSDQTRVANGELTDGVALAANSHIDLSYSLSSGNSLFILYELSSAVDVRSFMLAGISTTGAYTIGQYNVYLSSSVTGASLFAQTPTISYTNSAGKPAQDFCFQMCNRFGTLESKFSIPHRVILMRWQE